MKRHIVFTLRRIANWCGIRLLQRANPAVLVPALRLRGREDLEITYFKADQLENLTAEDEFMLMILSGDAPVAIVWPHEGDELVIPVGGHVLGWLDQYSPEGEPDCAIAGIFVGCGPVKTTSEGLKLFPLSLRGKQEGIPVPANADILVIHEHDLTKEEIAAIVRSSYGPSRLQPVST